MKKIALWVAKVTGAEKAIRKHERQIICYEIIHFAGWLNNTIEGHNTLVVLHRHLNKFEYPLTLPCHEMRSEIEDYKLVDKVIKTEYSQIIDPI